METIINNKEMMDLKEQAKTVLKDTIKIYVLIQGLYIFFDLLLTGAFIATITLIQTQLGMLPDDKILTAFALKIDLESFIEWHEIYLGIGMLIAVLISFGCVFFSKPPKRFMSMVNILLLMALTGHSVFVYNSLYEWVKNVLYLSGFAFIFWLASHGWVYWKDRQSTALPASDKLISNF